ncbi:MAG: hypothetical protein M5U34_06010 [Chloroflexi bacterium]|nr:hypothetical protein [Chloroflexota bacterium]
MSKEKRAKNQGARGGNGRYPPCLSPKKPAPAEFVPMGIAYRETAGGGGMRGLRQTAVLDLQRTLGNAATQQQVQAGGPEGMVQRVVINNAPTSETLHNTQTRPATTVQMITPSAPGLIEALPATSNTT